MNLPDSLLDELSRQKQVDIEYHKKRIVELEIQPRIEQILEFTPEHPLWRCAVAVATCHNGARHIGRVMEKISMRREYPHDEGSDWIFYIGFGRDGGFAGGVEFKEWEGHLIEAWTKEVSK